jgi:hypothetical protein
MSHMIICEPGHKRAPGALVTGVSQFSGAFIHSTQRIGEGADLVRLTTPRPWSLGPWVLGSIVAS